MVRLSQQDSLDKTTQSASSSQMFVILSEHRLSTLCYKAHVLRCWRRLDRKVCTNVGFRRTQLRDACSVHVKSAWIYGRRLDTFLFKSGAACRQPGDSRGATPFRSLAEL
jgi:hypothetical protein